MVFPLINEILKTQTVHDKTGAGIPLEGNIDHAEGLFLYDLIKTDSKISRTLEIGCAFGISSLFICGALQERSKPEHIIIDPFQNKKYYKGIGVLNLERAGVHFHKLYDDKSEFVLPNLLHEAPASFDVILIDGFHSFDQASLDFYYANRLLKVGGYVVFDDCSLASISKVLAYALKFPAYHLHSKVEEKSKLKKILRFLFSLLPEAVYTYLLPLKVNHLRNRVRFSSMVALQKKSIDERPNHWITDF